MMMMRARNKPQPALSRTLRDKLDPHPKQLIIEALVPHLVGSSSF